MKVGFQRGNHHLGKSTKALTDQGHPSIHNITFIINALNPPYLLLHLSLIMIMVVPANICWSSRHVLKASSKCLQRNNYSFSKTSWKRLEDVLNTSWKAYWKRLGGKKIVTVKTSWGCLQDISWRRLEDMPLTGLQDVFKKSSKRLGDKQNVY